MNIEKKQKGDNILLIKMFRKFKKIIIFLFDKFLKSYFSNLEKDVRFFIKCEKENIFFDENGNYDDLKVIVYVVVFSLVLFRILMMCINIKLRLLIGFSLNDFYFILYRYHYTHFDYIEFDDPWVMDLVMLFVMAATMWLPWE